MQGHLDAVCSLLKMHARDLKLTLILLLQLKESAAACMAYYHQLQPARIPREDISHPLDVLEYDGQWGMGDLPRLREVTRILSQTLAEVSQQAKDEEKAARSLEGSLLKSKFSCRVSNCKMQY